MTHFPQILIVDDDSEILDLLSTFLQSHSYQVATAADGVAMHQQLQHLTPDLIVLDIMLPGDDGLSLCRQLRATSTIPIIMLTAVDADMDRIIGLEMGADDYVTKPFNPRELLARIKAVLRRAEYAESALSSTEQAQENRSKLPPSPCFQFDNWILDVGKRELRVALSKSEESGLLVSLTAGEFDLLLAFVENPQRVLSRDQLLEHTKGYEAVNFDRSIDVQLSRLRRKIEADSKKPRLIKTVRGGGYMFTPTVKRIGSRP